MSAGANAARPVPMPRISKQAKQEEDRWRAEDDLRTLQRAAEVRSDQERMERAMSLHRKQSAGLEQIVKPADRSSVRRASKSTPSSRLADKKI